MVRMRAREHNGTRHSELNTRGFDLNTLLESATRDHIAAAIAEIISAAVAELQRTGQ